MNMKVEFVSLGNSNQWYSIVVKGGNIPAMLCYYKAIHTSFFEEQKALDVMKKTVIASKLTD